MGDQANDEAEEDEKDDELADEGVDGDWKKGFQCEQNINYVGAFFAKLSGKSFDDCGKKCKRSKKCHVFVHNTKRECYLKERVTKADHGIGGTTSCKDEEVTYHYSLLEMGGRPVSGS